MGNPQPNTYHIRYAVHRLDVGWLFATIRSMVISLRYSQAPLERVQEIFIISVKWIDRPCSGHNWANPMQTPPAIVPE